LAVQNETLRAEVDSLRLKLQLTTDEVVTLRTALEQSSASGDRMYHDSDAAVQNIGHRVYEQKCVLSLITFFQ